MTSDPKKKLLPRLILCLAIIGILLCFARLTFISRAFYDSDSYYNMAVTGFIRDHGFHYDFRWAQFSVFKDAFADKDLLLHIFTLPFLSLSGDPVHAGKIAIIVSIVLFVAVYVFLLRKYIPDRLAALFLLLPFLSPIFSVYMLELRSVSLANMLLLLGIYSLINRKTLWLLFISALYPLAHMSFPLLIALAVICECLRYFSNGEFFVKNICVTLAGCVFGCLIHPNFPNNLLYMYLNGILVPFYNFGGMDLGFSGELKALGANVVFLYNFAVFFGMAAISWDFFRNRRRIGLATRVWFAAALIFLTAAFFSLRFWYQANAIFFIFASSYICGLPGRRKKLNMSPKAKIAAVALMAIVSSLLLYNFVALKGFLTYLGARNAQYQDTAEWMKNNIPEGETVYHSYWDDASCFICINPKNNYLNTNDPIYMFYIHPKECALIDHLSMGRVADPHEAIAKIFKANYGYVRKEEPLFRQVASDRRHFKIIYENGAGAIFEILNDPLYGDILRF